MMSFVECFHFRAEKIEVGQDIPHTIPVDQDDPSEVKGLPQVWFTIGSPEKIPYLGTEQEIIWEHHLRIRPENIVKDCHINHWGVTTDPAIVQAVKKIKNPYC